MLITVLNKANHINDTDSNLISNNHSNNNGNNKAAVPLNTGSVSSGSVRFTGLMRRTLNVPTILLFSGRRRCVENRQNGYAGSR